MKESGSEISLIAFETCLVGSFAVAEGRCKHTENTPRS